MLTHSVPERTGAGVDVGYAESNALACETIRFLLHFDLRICCEQRIQFFEGAY